MSVRTKTGQSTGTNRGAGLPQFSNRPYVVHASAGSCGVRLYGRTVSQLHFGRIRWMDTGYTSTACLKSFAGTSAEKVDDGDER